jgi:uncharacterized protein
MQKPRAARAWILTGGWPGHDPEGVAAWTGERLRSLGLTSEVVRDLDALLEPDALEALALIVPNWSMGEIRRDQTTALVTAVERGLGLVGSHGGMGDAFRGSLDYQWLVGGQFVGHPGDVRPHRVSFDPGSPLLGDLGSIALVSERYAMLVDPAARRPAAPDRHDGLRSARRLGGWRAAVNLAPSRRPNPLPGPDGQDTTHASEGMVA